MVDKFSCTTGKRVGDKRILYLNKTLLFSNSLSKSSHLPSSKRSSNGNSDDFDIDILIFDTQDMLLEEWEGIAERLAEILGHIRCKDIFIEIDPGREDAIEFSAKAIFSGFRVRFKQSEILGVTGKDLEAYKSFLRIVQKIRDVKGVQVIQKRDERVQELLQRLKTFIFRYLISDKKKILLINLSPDPHFLRMCKTIVPLSIFRMSAFFGDGKDIEIMQFCPYCHDEAAMDKIKSFGPDAVMITTFCTFCENALIDTIKLLRGLGTATIFTGGILATLCPENTRRSGTDFTFTGDIYGMDRIEPSYDLIDKFYPDATMIISRTTKGCPNNCTYCGYFVISGRNIKFTSPDDCIKEIRNIEEHCSKIDEILLIDDNCTVNYDKHMKVICSSIKELSRRSRIDLAFEPNKLSESIIDDLDGSVDSVVLGFDDMHEEILKKLKRAKTDMLKLRKNIRIFKRKNIDAQIQLIIGLPEQSIKDMIENIIFCITMESGFEMNPFVPTPRTEEYKNLKRIISDKNIMLDDLKPGTFKFRNDGDRKDIAIMIDIMTNSRGWYNPRDYPADLDGLMSRKESFPQYGEFFRYIETIIDSNRKMIWENYLATNHDSYEELTLPDDVVDLYESEKDILEIGCAYGYNILSMAYRNPDRYFTGLDISEYAIDAATGLSKRLPDGIPENSNLVCSDIFEFKPDTRYDLIIDHRTSEFFTRDELERYPGKLKELLKEGGRAVIYISNEIPEKSIIPLHIKDPFRIVEALEDSGFDVISGNMHHSKTIDTVKYEFTLKPENNPSGTKCGKSKIPDSGIPCINETVQNRLVSDYENPNDKSSYDERDDSQNKLDCRQESKHDNYHDLERLKDLIKEHDRFSIISIIPERHIETEEDSANTVSAHIIRLAEFIGTDKTVTVRNHFSDTKQESIERFISDNHPEVFFLSINYTFLEEIARDLISTIRKFSPESKIIIGGFYPSVCEDSASGIGADLIFRGSIPGFEFKYVSPEIIRRLYPEAKTLYIESSRGCPNSCTYCSFSKYSERRMRFMDPIKFVDNIEDIKIACPKIRAVVLTDENCSVNYRSHLKRIISETKERKIDVSYILVYDSKPVNDEMIEDFNGMTDFIFLSVEDIHKDVLRRINRVPTDLKSLRNNVKRLIEKNIKPELQFLVGLPEQTTEDVLENIIFTLSLSPKDFDKVLFTLHPFILMPATAEFDNLKYVLEEKGISLKDLSPGKMPFLPEERQVYFREMINLLSGEDTPTWKPKNFVKRISDIFKLRPINEVQMKIKDDMIMTIKRMRKTIWDNYIFMNSENLLWNDNHHEIISNIDENYKTVIDLGCSTGQQTNLLGKENPDKKIIGIDFSESAISIASTGKPDNVSYIVADIMDDGFPQPRGDLVIDRGFSHTVEDYGKYADKVCGMIADGGRIRIFTIHDRRFFRDDDPSESLEYHFRDYDSIVKTFNRKGMILTYSRKDFDGDDILSSYLEFVKIPPEIHFIDDTSKDRLFFGSFDSEEQFIRSMIRLKTVLEEDESVFAKEVTIIIPDGADAFKALSNFSRKDIDVLTSLDLTIVISDFSMLSVFASLKKNNEYDDCGSKRFVFSTRENMKRRIIRYPAIKDLRKNDDGIEFPKKKIRFSRKEFSTRIFHDDKNWIPDYGMSAIIRERSLEYSSENQNKEDGRKEEFFFVFGL